MRLLRYWMLNEDGRTPVATDDVIEWGIWFEHFENRVLAQTDILGGGQVSTVFLGIDHAFDDGPPVLWESMVFLGAERDDVDMDRYATYDEALAGHARLVAKWTGQPARAGPDDP